MISNQDPLKISRRGSYGLALIFILIAVIGAALMFSSPPGSSKSIQTEKNTSAEGEQEQTYKSSYYGYFIRTILITGSIIVLFIVGVKIYRRRVKSDISDRLKMEIIGRKYIGPKHYLLMVRIENRKLLLGVTDNSINLISEHNGDDTTKNFDKDKTVKEPDTFPKVLKRLKTKRDY